MTKAMNEAATGFNLAVAPFGFTMEKMRVIPGIAKAMAATALLAGQET